MKLRNIYIICKNNIEVLDVSLADINISGRAGYRVSEWERCLHALEEVKRISFLENMVINVIEKVPSFYISRDSFDMLASDFHDFYGKLNMVYDAVKTIVDLCESMGMVKHESGIGLDIKLPNCVDFSDYMHYISELEFVLYKCPFFRGVEALKFCNVDVGSNWLNFLIVTAGEVGSRICNNIAAFIDKCYIVKSHKLSIEQQRIMLDTMKMEQEAKEKVLDGITLIYNEQVKQAVAELEAETGIKLKDCEQRDIAIMAMEKTNSLLEKGMQIYTAIDSPKDIQVLFQPLEMKYLSDVKVELLEEKND